ncbi:hypothetical protein CEXT_597401 [Caerostris extrusa]|uniref:Uncharacterized protein n=1 Tax=Caerostris extrusa TaxID=172846 RepID=A0AAV4PV68_CAEEX|nr:hypothetical protein CEXT_597401 [Caerostris extrusa]
MHSGRRRSPGRRQTQTYGGIRHSKESVSTDLQSNFDVLCTTLTEQYGIPFPTAHSSCRRKANVKVAVHEIQKPQVLLISNSIHQHVSSSRPFKQMRKAFHPALVGDCQGEQLLEKLTVALATFRFLHVSSLFGGGGLTLSNARIRESPVEGFNVYLHPGGAPWATFYTAKWFAVFGMNSRCYPNHRPAGLCVLQKDGFGEESCCASAATWTLQVLEIG